MIPPFWQRPALSPLIASTAAFGSTVGAGLSTRLAARVGSLRWRASKLQARVKRTFEHNDSLAAFLPVIAHDRAPSTLHRGGRRGGNAAPRFFVRVCVGSMVRHSLQDFVGARYGHQAVDILRHHYCTIAPTYRREDERTSQEMHRDCLRVPENLSACPP